MPTYTVKEILNSRPWPSAEDTKTVYYDFLVEEDPRKVNAGRKPGNPLTVGTKLEGTLEHNGRSGNGAKFVRASTGGGGGGRPRDPRESARIMRQHSQEMALRYAEVKGKNDLRLDDDFRKVIDWFDADAKAAQP